MPPKLIDLVDYLLLSIFRDINDDGERSQRRIRPLSRYIRRYIPAALLNVVNDIHFPAWDLDVDAFHFSSLTVTRMAAAMLECRPVLADELVISCVSIIHSIGRIDEHCNAGHAGDKVTHAAEKHDELASLHVRPKHRDHPIGSKEYLDRAQTGHQNHCCSAQPMSLMGQKHELPRRSIAVRFAPNKQTPTRRVRCDAKCHYRP
jgi:hypothetical protein